MICATCLLLLTVLSLFLWIYLYVKKRHEYWKSMGVPQTKTSLFFGSFGDFFLKRKNYTSVLSSIYEMTKQRYIGMYMMTDPILMIRCPKLIKQLCIKDFDYFIDHKQFISEDEPLWGRNLFSLKGHEWKAIRATLSPAFTGSKMRFMSSLINDTANEVTNYFLEKTKQNAVNIELKDFFTRLTNDIICTTSFGLANNSFVEPNNMLFKMGHEATDIGGAWKQFIFFAKGAAPKLFKFFGINLMSTEVGKFFESLITENMKTRIEKGIVRPDMIHILMQAKNNTLTHEEDSVDTTMMTLVTGGSLDPKSNNDNYDVKTLKKKITDEDIIANALIFFFAGYDTMASGNSFMAYELAVNPDIQSKLANEIDETIDRHDGVVKYEDIVQLKYLEMVILEALRKYPPAPSVDRVCVKPYTIQPEEVGEPPVTLQKGDTIWIPIGAIHMDPKYYPNPDIFDPERFSTEKRDSFVSDAFIPFGVGPRNCIGFRLAIIQMKIIFFHMLSKFEIIRTDKTEVPVKLGKLSMLITAENGMFVGLRKRNDLKNFTYT